jgi:hypothetical protein
MNDYLLKQWTATKEVHDEYSKWYKSATTKKVLASIEENFKRVGIDPDSLNGDKALYYCGFRNAVDSILSSLKTIYESGITPTIFTSNLDTDHLKEYGYTDSEIKDMLENINAIEEEKLV